MIKKEEARKYYLDRVTRAIKSAVTEFTESMNGQVNLSSQASQDGITNRIVSHLVELDLLQEDECIK